MGSEDVPNVGCYNSIQIVCSLCSLTLSVFPSNVLSSKETLSTAGVDGAQLSVSSASASTSTSLGHASDDGQIGETSTAVTLPQVTTVRSWLPEASLLGVAFIWGINIPIMKNGLDQMEWYSFNAARLTLSAVVLAVLGWREWRLGRGPAVSISRTQIVIYAVIVSVIYQFLFLLGISRATSGNTGLILSTIPMWTALAARVFLKERLAPLAWLGLMVAFAGTLIVTLQSVDPAAARSSMAGNLFTLGAALSWAAGTVYSRPLMKGISPTQLSAWSAVLGLPFHLLIAASTLPSSIGALQIPAVWMTVLYSGVFSTGLALVMWNFGVRHTGAAQAAVFQNLVPVIAIFTAWLFRGESVTVHQIVGGAMIISGLVIMRRQRRPVAV